MHMKPNMSPSLKLHYMTIYLPWQQLVHQSLTFELAFWSELQVEQLTWTSEAVIEPPAAYCKQDQDFHRYQWLSLDRTEGHL